MVILECTASNFGSYDAVSFRFKDLGLSLIYGPTGAGKSTLFDIVAWTLYGITAKQGSADDVKSWTNPGSVTEGIVTLTIDDKEYTVVRIRGKSSQNDLYWQTPDSDENHRGKDMADTQRLLNDLLGVDGELYLALSYYSDSSPSGLFFDSKAKDRREVLEKIANLSFPLELGNKIASYKKELKTNVQALHVECEKQKAVVQQMAYTLEKSKGDARAWEEARQARIAALTEEYTIFLADKKNQIDMFTSQLKNLKVVQAEERKNAKPCTTCGSIDYVKDRYIENEITATEKKIYALNLSVHPNRALIDNEKRSKNPFSTTANQEDLDKAKTALQFAQNNFNFFSKKLTSLETVENLNKKLKTRLLENSVREVENFTNECLEEYFDGEFRVEFELKDSDSLAAYITRNGYECVYRQLSKGQKGLLRLCFSVAVMKACSMRSGVHPSLLMFDEPVDGADSDLKTKSFRLFDNLSQSYNTVLVIDHNEEFKELFNTKFKVELVNDTSHIKEDRESPENH